MKQWLTCFYPLFDIVFLERADQVWMYIWVDISYTSCMYIVFLFTYGGLDERCISFEQVFVVYLKFDSLRKQDVN